MIRQPTNKNARGQAGGFTKADIDTKDHSKPDPLMGWFGLAKPSRQRQQKSSWKRGRK